MNSFKPDFDIWNIIYISSAGIKVKSNSYINRWKCLQDKSLAFCPKKTELEPTWLRQVKQISSMAISLIQICECVFFLHINVIIKKMIFHDKRKQHPECYIKINIASACSALKMEIHRRWGPFVEQDLSSYTHGNNWTVIV